MKFFAARIGGEIVVLAAESVEKISQAGDWKEILTPICFVNKIGQAALCAGEVMVFEPADQGYSALAALCRGR
jgi:hypothetical protein